MSELKTLKELDFSEQIFTYNKYSVENERIHNRLKQEAIKHYKVNIGEWNEHKPAEWAKDYKYLAEWIKHFFNISEDDLE